MDYAQDLLGGRETGAPNKDYASELLGPVTAIEGRSQLTKPKQAQKQGMSLSDIDLANADNNEGTADFTTLSKAAMVDDPGTKIRILAKARFPDMPEKEAMSRYGIVEGVPIYLGKDDKIYRETPTGVRGFAKRAAAQVVGSSRGDGRLDRWGDCRGCYPGHCSWGCCDRRCWRPCHRQVDRQRGFQRAAIGSR
jgi:hypothetical protein